MFVVVLLVPQLSSPSLWGLFVCCFLFFMFLCLYSATYAASAAAAAAAAAVSLQESPAFDVAPPPPPSVSSRPARIQSGSVREESASIEKLVSCLLQLHA